MSGAVPADDEAACVRRLRSLLARAESGLARITDEELLELPRLYRFAASRLALLETRGGDPAGIARARALAARAHALLFRGLDRPRESPLARAGRFLSAEVPRAIRSEWKVIAASLALLYGIAGIAWAAVSRDLELAWSLMQPEMVAQEIGQLQATAEGEAFRGNFTFGLGESAPTAGWIMAHNMSVGILFFASALVPPLYLYVLATNGLMLGTYTAVAGHWGQTGAISSILWCHGTIELQAIALAGAAGLVLARAWIAPGPWSRREAMRIESARAWRLIAPVFPMLFLAGLIEGFVSPHAPLAVRVAVAAASGIAILAWVVLGGRRGEPLGASLTGDS